jgi:uncharacterized protein YqeY
MSESTSNLEGRLNEDLKTAMREKNTLRKSVIQMIRSQVLLEKKKGGDAGEIDDARIMRMIRAHAKKLQDALDHAEKAGREDLVEQAKKELEITEGYLPAAISDEELQSLVEEIVAQQDARGPKAMGPVMKEVLARVEGRADGKQVQGAVRKALGMG